MLFSYGEVSHFGKHSFALHQFWPPSFWCHPDWYLFFSLFLSQLIFLDDSLNLVYAGLFFSPYRSCVPLSYLMTRFRVFYCNILVNAPTLFVLLSYFYLLTLFWIFCNYGFKLVYLWLMTQGRIRRKISLSRWRISWLYNLRRHFQCLLQDRSQ